jgi:hypothetical protein
MSAVFFAGSAMAGPTAYLKGGKTTVQLSEEFVGALGALGVTPTAIKNGKLNLKKGEVSFRIPAGAIDVETLAGDIFHSGGLGLGVPGVQVSLLNFIISTTDDQVLTGLAAVNGDVVDRIPLFNLTLSPDAVDTSSGNKLMVGPVAVTLTAVAAATLNDVFGVDAFTPDFPIGTAYVSTKIKNVLGSSD